MKLLSKDTKVVNALKRILLGEDYFYLEYNESKSKGYDFLHIDVISAPRKHNADRFLQAGRRRLGENTDFTGIGRYIGCACRGDIAPL